MVGMEEPRLQRPAKGINPRIVIIAAIVLVILLAGAAGYFFKKYHDLQSSPSVANSKKSQKVVDEVAKIYILPTGEQPTVAQVKDKAKLSNQRFFKDAQNGDDVIIYTKAQVAVIYRESAHKIVAATNAINTSSTTGAQPGVQPNAKAKK